MATDVYIDISKFSVCPVIRGIFFGHALCRCCTAAVSMWSQAIVILSNAIPIVNSICAVTLQNRLVFSVLDCDWGKTFYLSIDVCARNTGVLDQKFKNFYVPRFYLKLTQNGSD